MLGFWMTTQNPRVSSTTLADICGEFFAIFYDSEGMLAAEAG
jgi:hypothetical protein